MFCLLPNLKSSFKNNAHLHIILCFKYGKARFLRFLKIPNLNFCKGFLGVLAYLMQVMLPNTTPAMV